MSDSKQKPVFPSDMPWYIRAIQGTIDFVMGLFGKNPDAGGK
jgi:hypothetical protein